MTSVLAFMYVPYLSKERRLAQSLAIQSMIIYENFFPIALDFKGTNKNLEEFETVPKLNVLKRNSRETIRNTRDLPYVKDIFDALSKIECDNIGYSNSDIVHWGHAIKVLELPIYKSYLFSRIDTPPIYSIDDEWAQAKNDMSHAGMDSIFFNRKWWIENRNLFPDDLIVGETEWDTIYRLIAKKHSRYIEARTVFHVSHKPQWNLATPGAKNNLVIFETIRRKYKI